MEKINEKNNLYEQFLKYSYKDLKELLYESIYYEKNKSEKTI